MLRLSIPATFMCAAPEVLTFLDEVEAGSSPIEGDLKAGDLSRADVWCLGVALAEMLYSVDGWMPFGHESRASVQQAQRQWVRTHHRLPELQGSAIWRTLTGNSGCFQGQASAGPR